MIPKSEYMEAAQIGSTYFSACLLHAISYFGLLRAYLITTVPWNAKVAAKAMKPPTKFVRK